MRGDLEHAAVEERHAQLQRAGHAHAVGLEQDVARQPDVDVEVLHPRHVVHAPHALPDRGGQRLRRRGGEILPQDAALLPQREQAAVADEALLQRLRPAQQEISAAEPRHPAGQGGQRPAQPERQPAVAGRVVRLAVDVVPAEQLVRAFAGKDDLHVFARYFRHKIQRGAGGVGQGLVHVILHRAQVAPVLLRRNHVGVVFQADLARKALGIADFVVPLVVAKPDGERLLPLEIARDIAGIHPAGKEAPDLHVADAVRRDGILEHLFDLGDGLFLRHGLVGVELRLPVTVDLHFPVAVPQAVRGRQAVHALEKRLRRDGVFERDVVVQRVGVQLFFKAGEREDAFNLRRIHEVPAELRVVHRLDAEKVACEEQAALLPVPDGEGEHAAQLVQQRLAPLLEPVEEDLAVRIRGKMVPVPDEDVPQFAVVINFAVEHQN